MRRITLADELVSLWAERALFWERAATLIIADLHLGKAAAFRASGIPVPEATTDADLHRLEWLVDRSGARRLLVLGDMLHARAGRSAETFDRFAQWRRRRREVKIELVRGNHDASAGDPPSAWEVESIDGPVVEPPFVFMHEPREDQRGYALGGHLHPAAVLDGVAGSVERTPCFWFGERVGVLPAFGSFTGMKAVRPAPGDSVFLVGEGMVVEAMTTGARLSVQ
ncbi:MAG TPA: ligase-associated DNA damage response endonuclease PdeM [Phycisphaerales bacterium]|nr:ligase-associated DNA damage response endonuclease PdeM [Phycisphaerales bacterium]